MKHLYLLLVLLYSIKLHATTIAPISHLYLSKKADSTSFHYQPKQSWMIRHRQLVVNSTATLATAGIIASSCRGVNKPLHKFTQDFRTGQSTTERISRMMQPFGTSLPIHATAGAFLLTGIVTKKPKMKDAAAVTLTSFYLNLGATTLLNNSLQRHRPHNVNHVTGLVNNNDNISTALGHTSAAFVTATSIASVYNDSPWIPPVAYGVATLVGLSRINDQHWASDALAGAVIGYLSGKVTYWGYQRLKQNMSKRHLLVRPGWTKQPTLAASIRF